MIVFQINKNKRVKNYTEVSFKLIRITEIVIFVGTILTSIYFQED